MKNCYLFDFADTIASLSPSREATLSMFLKEHGFVIEDNVLARVYRYLDVALPYSSVNIRANEDKKAFYLHYNDILLKMLGVRHRVNEADLYTFFIKCKAHWVLKDWVMELFVNLKNSSKKIALISNFDSKLTEIVHDIGIVDYLDHIYISQTVGLEKPNPLFYTSFFEKSMWRIEETIYVGDSYSLDYLPAEAIGLKVYIYDEVGMYGHLENRVSNFQFLRELC